MEDSNIISAIVSDIIDKSKYTGKTSNVNQGFEGVTIDDTELGFELRYGKEHPTENGIPIRKVRWNEKAIPQIYGKIQQLVSSNQPIRINGVRANFILSAICCACKQQGITDISAYDIRLKQYIPIKKFRQKRGLKENQGLRFNIIENKENIFIDVDIKGEQYTLEEYSRCLLPRINERKNLYLSGRMPLWLLASISNSYDSRRVFTFQPGKGFTCVSSVDEKDLGTIVDGIEGIDINRYFEEKRESDIIKSPAIFQRYRLFYGISRVFNKINDARRKAKYVNPKIKSKTLSTSEDRTTDVVALNINGQSGVQDKEVKSIYGGRMLMPEVHDEIGG